MQEIRLLNRWLWLSSLIILIILLELVCPAAAQRGGGTRGSGGGDGGSGAHGRQEYNLQTVTTVKGQVESLGSYGMTGWKAMPGMQVQGLAPKDR